MANSNRKQFNKKQGRKYTGKKRSNGGNQKYNPETQNNTKDFDAEHSNNITWWDGSVMFPEVTKVPFNVIAGTSLNRELFAPTNTVVDYRNQTGYVSMPSIMTIDFYPTFGIAKDSNAPVNRAFTSIYSEVYANTTGAMQFSQGDLSITSLAVDSLLCNIAQAKRLLGLSVRYEDSNYIYPRGVIKALGYDPSTIIGHQDHIRARLNDSISNLNVLCLPNFIKIFDRHYSLCRNVYADMAHPYAQLYVFRPLIYYKYDDTDANGESVKAFDMPTFDEEDNTMLYDIKELLDVIDEQLEAMRHSTAFSLVQGSLKRAFPSSSYLTVDRVTPEEFTECTPDKEILWQINNMNMVGELYTESLSVTQNPAKDMVLCTPHNSGNSILHANGFMLNSFTGDSDSTFVMEATRLITIMEHQPDDEFNSSAVVACGSEIVSSVSIYGFHIDGDLVPFAKQLTTYYPTVSPTGFIDTFMGYLNFTIRPTLFVTATNGYYGPINDFQFYTTIDSSAIEGLHTAAMLSAYSTAAAKVVGMNLKS